MKVLAIDTTNHVLGISLVDEHQVIGEYVTNVQKNHSVRVMPAINQLLSDCDTLPKELAKIIVAQGPGSYTGVRIGVTIAKTLAWSLGIELVGVSSLAVQAASGRSTTGLISPVFDARRGQIYTGLYRFKNNELETVKQDQIILTTDWVEGLKDSKEQILFIGNDAIKHWPVISSILGEKAVLAPSVLNNPRPSELAYLGYAQAGEDIHTFVPNYHRLVEAEVKWIEKQAQEKERR